MECAVPVEISSQPKGKQLNCVYIAPNLSTDYLRNSLDSLFFTGIIFINV